MKNKKRKLTAEEKMEWLSEYSKKMLLPTPLTQKQKVMLLGVVEKLTKINADLIELNGRLIAEIEGME
jgi:hypothetical protein